MLTPSARFTQNQPIQTSFSDLKKEIWDTANASVTTVVQVLIHLMLGDEVTPGCMEDSQELREYFAEESLSWNIANEEVTMF